jgi:hypothetical protein
LPSVDSHGGGCGGFGARSSPNATNPYEARFDLHSEKACFINQRVGVSLMTVKTIGKFALAALGMTALAGCITTNPAPPPAPAPVVIQTPVPAGSVVVTPKAY